ncbi:phage integrase central domain-containing protein [Novosphingobium panipatense]|uniref:phage integrase central domain-containing protein n=1 Tax=Novosphingobium panipatense TaxID=428991 RepID=UPI0039A39930
MAAVSATGLVYSHTSAPPWHVAQAWHTLQKGRWSKVHAEDVAGGPDGAVYPSLGRKAIEDIEAPDVRARLQGILGARGIQAAHRTRHSISAIQAPRSVAPRSPCPNSFLRAGAWQR